MRSNDADSRWGAPRLIGIAAMALGILVAMLVAYSGGASAVVGNTDLSITKTDSPDPVVQGNNLTYTITVSNNGTFDASGVVVTDNLPSSSDIDFVSATPTAGTCQHTGNTVTCDLGQVNAGTNATVTIVVKAKKSGTLSNTATVSATSGDTNSANNSATAATTVTKKGAPKPKGQLSCGAPTISGTPGDDVITGTSRKDAIATFGGNDVVYGGGGGDLICTGAGADRAFGQDGNDTVIAGSGNDLANGGKGGDTLKGKAGRDTLKGKSGDDFLNGGKGRDRCKGGSGADTIRRCP
jgi:uncharacterized repeat protein (TIGR01451 family)